jgi:hypothetical protein
MKKKENAIVVIKFGTNPMYDLSLETIKRYAEYRCNCDLIVLEELVFTKDRHKGHFCNEKFQMRDLFDKYDRLLYLDLDILVSPYAPNIFQIYPEGTWAYDESYLPWTDADASFFESKFNMSFPKIDGRKRMLNAGVQLLDKSIRPVLDQYDPDEFVPSFYNGTQGDEQTYWNMLISRNNYPVNHLDGIWNSLIYPRGLHLQPEVRKNQMFLHYAGRSYYPDFANLIFEDAVSLWGNQTNASNTVYTGVS